MSQLFDIAHADWEHHTKNLEDRQFLINQLGPQQMVMSNEDLNYRKAAAKHKKRKQDEECRHQRHTAELAQASATVEFSLPSESSSNKDDVSLDQPYCPTAKRKKNKQSTALSLAKRCIIDDSLFNAALDRTRTSTRHAMMIVTPALQAAGIDVDQLSLSRSSLMKARNNSHEVVAATVRQNFQPTVPLVAHFDSKLLANLAGTNHEHLAIVVSGLHVEKLLGIPMLPGGSGAMMGQKVVEFVHEWTGVENRLAALCFHTTASNTGIHKGAITIVQNSFS